VYNKKSFARVRQKSKYRRMRREDERNWKITAPVDKIFGGVISHQDAIGDHAPHDVVGGQGAMNQYNFSETEFRREMNRSWNRRKK